MDGLTTNGVLIMHPKGGFCGGNAKCGLWRETSLGGEVFSLRESRSAQQKGQPVSYWCSQRLLLCAAYASAPSIRLFGYLSHPTFFVLSFISLSSHSQIKDENNVLQDGTLIDLCGATLLWRSHEGLSNSPVSRLSTSLYYSRRDNFEPSNSLTQWVDELDLYLVACLWMRSNAIHTKKQKH